MTPAAFDALLSTTSNGTQPKGDAQPQGAACAGRRILVVDDERMNRSLLANLLDRNGYQTVQASGGSEALNVVAEGSVDFVLLDIVMPEIDGFEVLAKIREQYSAAELPVIMVTADNDAPQIVKAFKQGANDYVTKPVDVDIAVARIDTQIKLRDAQNALRASEERYALAAQGTNDGLWDWQLVAGDVYFSERWKSMLGVEVDRVMNSPDDWLGRIHEEDRRRVEHELHAHLTGELPHFEVELRMLHEDGNYRWMICRGMAIRDQQGRATRIAGSLTDITEGKVADALTGLPNRLLFRDRLQKVIDNSYLSQEEAFAVLYLDLDNFKLVNDSLGHEAGDQLLLAVARRLEACVRSRESIVARLGGDEFSILLERTKSQDCALQVAERVIDAMNAPFTLGSGREVFTTASVGISYVEQRSASAEDLLREADTAMYEAKSQGKSQHRFFDPKMHQQVNERLDLESDLRRATESNQLLLHYQPIVELHGGKLLGFEALVRWQHPKLGLVAPHQFIPIAEETGLIEPIGQWVLEEACRQMSEWSARFEACKPLSISVNLSSKQLGRGGLEDNVSSVLRNHGLDPGRLRIEVTESAIMEYPEQSAEVLERLRSKGARIGIDDFGTGYSSLSALHRLPVDVLKVDRSFVNKMLQSPENSAIVKTILSLADNLSLDVIAEGVETIEQLHHLRAMGCPYAQGFLFSRPLDCEQVEQLYQSQTADPPALIHPGCESSLAEIAKQ